MIVIRRDTIGEAHNAIVSYIHDSCKGLNRQTEDDESTLDLEEPLCVHIDYPMCLPMRSPNSLFGDKFISSYKDSLKIITPRRNDGTDASYTYGNRLRDYPVAHLERKSIFKYIITYLGDGNLGGIDQIEKSIIDRLVKHPSSRRAISITWWPERDIDNPEPPCLQFVQAIIDSRSKLNLISLFRSNDMLSAWGMNAIGLSYLQDYIISEINSRSNLNISTGYLETISISPHIYYHRDALELSRFISRDTLESP